MLKHILKKYCMFRRSPIYEEKDHGVSFPADVKKIKKNDDNSDCQNVCNVGLHNIVITVQ